MKPFYSFLSYIFLTNDESRLRAGWRLFIALFLTGLFFNIVDWINSALSLTEPMPVIPSLGIDLIVVTSAIYIARRFFDRRSFASLGLHLNKQTLSDIVLGIVIAFVVMSIVYIIEHSLGWLTFESFAWQSVSSSEVLSQTLRGFLVYAHTGFKEELIFRGYVLQTLVSGLNLFWGVVISSLYFGIEHLSNPHSSWMSTAGIVIIGLFFAYGYLRTGQLWLPIGLHFGWNFFENALFGFPVSGFDRPGLFHINVSGPELWTGGAFGPEAGLLMIPVCLIGALLIHTFTKGRTLASTDLNSLPNDDERKV
jgi:membrane protease YdiL (CAAX protease family)